MSKLVEKQVINKQQSLFNKQQNLVNKDIW